MLTLLSASAPIGFCPSCFMVNRTSMLQPQLATKKPPKTRFCQPKTQNSSPFFSTKKSSKISENYQLHKKKYCIYQKITLPHHHPQKNHSHTHFFPKGHHTWIFLLRVKFVPQKKNLPPIWAEFLTYLEDPGIHQVFKGPI